MNTPVFTDPQLSAEVQKFTRTRKIKKDGVLIAPGDKILFVPIVQKGGIKDSAAGR